MSKQKFTRAHIQEIIRAGVGLDTRQARAAAMAPIIRAVIVLFFKPCGKIRAVMNLAGDSAEEHGEGPILPIP
jgi:hypothetical protein